MASKHQLAKIEFVKVWVTRLPSLSHPPLSMWRHRVTCLPPKNASAPWGGSGSRWLTIIVRQVSYIQYLPACKKSQRSTPYNIIKSVLAWSRVFRRRHLGRRVTAVTCLRWPTVLMGCACTYVAFQDVDIGSIYPRCSQNNAGICDMVNWRKYTVTNDSTKPYIVEVVTLKYLLSNKTLSPSICIP